MPEWTIERGIGETRAILVENGEILEARVLLDGEVPAGSVIDARLARVGIPGVAEAHGREYLLPRGAPGLTQGAALRIEVTREAIPGAEPWKRPLARMTDEAPQEAAIEGEALPFPAADDRLGDVGWWDLLEEARSGIVRFEGGELRLFVTSAMTLIDVDGRMPPAELAVAGARAAAVAIRRHGIGGSIGIDLPTVAGKAQRQAAAEALDAVLPQPFERTAVNGFGFLQVVRPRTRASMFELAADRTAFEARVLLRRAALEPAGARRLVAHPAIVALLTERRDWIDQLSRQLGGPVGLRADAALPMSGGYAEPA